MNASKVRYFLIGFCILAAATALGTLLWLSLATPPQMGGWEQRPLEGLRRYGTVPEFALVERSGQPTSLEDLRGSVWVADFIYTSCTDTCPLQSAQLAKLQAEFADRDGVKLLSFSVDPKRDTPQVLSRYAERFKADPERWLFLTGEKREVIRLAQDGFKLSAAPAAGGEGKNNGVVLHSSRFVLVDRAGAIRGYYDSSDAEALRRLRKDLIQLLRISRQGSTFDG